MASSSLILILTPGVMLYDLLALPRFGFDMWKAGRNIRCLFLPFYPYLDSIHTMAYSYPLSVISPPPGHR
jgi:hypothetical protein